MDNPSADMLKRDVGFTPRMQNGRVTGLILTARGPGFQQAGFQPGDVVTQVDGQPLGSLSDLQALQGRIMPETGRASCRERVCQYVSISVVAVSFKKKKHNIMRYRNTYIPSHLDKIT